MNDCIVLIGKKGLYDNAAEYIARCFDGTLTDAVFIDESSLACGTGIKGYVLASRYCPSLSGLFIKKFIKRYKIKEKKPKQFKESRIKLPVSAHKKCENLLYRFYPKAVICFTPRALALTLSAAKTTGYKGCVVSAIYDFAPSAGMTLKGADVYLAATAFCARKAERRGIDKERIRQVGFPVKASAISREKALKQLGITGEKPVVLIAGGRYCSGRAMEAAREFSAYSDRMQVVLSGGARGARWIEKNCPSVLVAGEEDMDVLYAAADVAALAPTAFIAAESMKNRIPVVLLPPVNKGQKSVYKALKEVCVCTQSAEEAVKAVMEILMDKTAYAPLTERAFELVGEREQTHSAIRDILAEYADKDVFGDVILPKSDVEADSGPEANDAAQEQPSSSQAEREEEAQDEGKDEAKPRDEAKPKEDAAPAKEQDALKEAESDTSARQKKRFKLFGRK